jgi:type IV pilus assembly protein PilZ
MPEKTDKSKKPARRADRLQHELLVAYRTVDGFITDWATNISHGGIFINTRNPLAVGTTVRLIISLPDTAFPFDLTGRVTRVNEFDNPSNQVPGMGIEFVDVDDEKRARIDRFVDRLRKELPDSAGEVKK